MKIEYIHSQRMQISDQGITLTIDGDVNDLHDIASGIQTKGVFHLPKGKLVRRDDFIVIDGGRITVESDSHTLNRIMELGTKFQFPAPRSEHVETPTANRGYQNNELPLPVRPEPLVPYQNQEVEYVENTREELPLIPPTLF
jgi:hypothetical protein